MNKNNKKGFTLIEVVLVLAIGGLIILMALLVFPNAMANLRDTTRREDYAQLATNVNQYSASNNGKIIRLLGRSATLTTAAGPNPLSASTYINNTGEDPNGYPYDLKVYNYEGWKSAGEPIPKADDTGTQVYLVIGADCDGDSDDPNVTFSIPGQNNSTKAFAVFGGLEGSSKTYCSANMQKSSSETGGNTDTE